MMTSKARDHMFLIMLLISPLRYTSRKFWSYYESSICPVHWQNVYLDIFDVGNVLETL